MVNRHSPPWESPETRDLLETILSLRDLDEAECFFRDLCTLGELEAMAHRWAVAKLLDQDSLPYHEIARRTGASTATVTRVAHWLRHGEDGYRLALDRRKRKTSSARTG
jgi:TrpR-related protein YerC/YecD